MRVVWCVLSFRKLQLCDPSKLTFAAVTLTIQRREVSEREAMVAEWLSSISKVRTDSDNREPIQGVIFPFLRMPNLQNQYPIAYRLGGMIFASDKNCSPRRDRCRSKICAVQLNEKKSLPKNGASICNASSHDDN